MQITQLQNMDQVTVCTHGGQFHADDLVAVAVVAAAVGGLDRIKVIRSRNPEDWARSDVIVDVGGRFEATQRQIWLDHHQDPGPCRPCGQAYAAAGLAWLWFGQSIIRTLGSNLTSQQIDDVWKIVEAGVIKPCDAVDNGVELIREYVNPELQPFTYAQAIDNLNPSWLKDQSALASRLLFLEILRNRVFPDIIAAIEKALARVLAKAVIDKALTQREDPRILVLERGLPWQALVVESNRIVTENEGTTQVQFVVFPDVDGQWRVQGVPIFLGSYSLWRKLPAAWAGLRSVVDKPEGEKSLAEVSGVLDAVFCHKQLFIGGALSKEGAIALAKKALES